ncbi:hypothetical protein SLEP1_g30710 [Rubroshorea leprosula]|uniref:Uncharacterized protein n=1 Tax=Rubroshorea leprosula TaxID=152421 RepID=A0AAV5K6X0_9ROSI|nr:hypothetical protein SLEP1_g30710 [Rubroshorea leprosula]
MQMPIAEYVPTVRKAGSEIKHLNIDHKMKGKNVTLISLARINIGPGAGGCNKGHFSGSFNEAEGNSHHTDAAAFWEVSRGEARIKAGFEKEHLNMIKGKSVIFISLGSINIGPGAGGYNKGRFSGSFNQANRNLPRTDAAAFCKMPIAEGMLTVHTTDVCVEKARINAGSGTNHLEIDQMIKGKNVILISMASINIGPGAGRYNKDSFSGSINNAGTETEFLNIDHMIEGKNIILISLGSINVGPGAGANNEGSFSGSVNQAEENLRHTIPNNKTNVSGEEAWTNAGSKTERLDIDHITNGENVILISLGSINIGPGAGAHNKGPSSGSINQAKWIATNNVAVD